KAVASKAVPTHSLSELQRQLNTLFGYPFLRSGRTEDLGFTGYGPAIDIYENSEGFYLSADVPGFSNENFQIRYENRTLTIAGERPQEDTENMRYHRKESFAGRFERSFSLSADIDSEKITAELKNGVLTVFLPKQEAVKPRQISVKVN
ncbi:MAG: Hsp20/alpha crystallin family protein, partial [Acidobacteriota bacterium]